MQEHQKCEGRSNETRHTHDAVLLLALYIVLASIAAAAKLPLLKALSSAFALAIFTTMLVNFAYTNASTHANAHFGFAIFCYTSSILFSSLYINRSDSLIDIIKIAIAPGFFLFGAASEQRGKNLHHNTESTRKFFFLLIILPALALATQAALYGIPRDGFDEFSLFANKNNAALYAITLCALYNSVLKPAISNPFIYLGIGISFGTIGILVATTIALLTSIKRWGPFLFILCSILILAVVYWYDSELKIFKRISPIVNTITYLLEGRINVRTSSYAELISVLQTHDLSFIFRLKQWTDLYDIFVGGTPLNWFFGYGLGSSARLSQSHLVPHNDYIRLAFECGIIPFIAFAYIVTATIFKIGRRWELVPILSVAIYFFSENLINNFVAMAMFFYSSGSLWSRESLRTRTRT